MNKTILSFGEILWDILPDRTVLGGAPFNFAYRAHDLGYRCAMISRVGNDRLGEKALRAMTALGLDTSLVQHDDRLPTGTVKVVFDTRGVPDYDIIPDVAYDNIQLSPGIERAASEADALCFGVLAQRRETSRRTLRSLIRSAGHALKFLDINLRKECFTEETIGYSLEEADVLKLNEDEAVTLSRMLSPGVEALPEICEKIIDTCSLRHCLVTLGPRGAFAASASGERVYTPGIDVPIADTVGSGDAFSAGFLTKLLDGASLKEACAYGNVLGTVVATQQGATAAVGTEDIRRLSADNLPRLVDQSLAKPNERL